MERPSLCGAGPTLTAAFACSDKYPGRRAFHFRERSGSPKNVFIFTCLTHRVSWDLSTFPLVFSWEVTTSLSCSLFPSLCTAGLLGGCVAGWQQTASVRLLPPSRGWEGTQRAWFPSRGPVGALAPQWQQISSAVSRAATQMWLTIREGHLEGQTAYESTSYGAQGRAQLRLLFAAFASLFSVFLLLWEEPCL